MTISLTLIAAVLIKAVESASNSNYIVLTTECKIPYFPAFSDEANAVFQPQNYTACTDSQLLTFTKVVNNTAYLHLNEENEIFHQSDKPLNCCFSYVSRNGTEEEPDVGISISECVHFNATVQLQEQVVLVKCENDTSQVYENVHHPITITEPVQKKLKKWPRRDPQDSPISVLIMVIDSMSRLNFNRTMPLTRKFLLQNKFVDFLAYNKVDDNTFPNAMALLTGKNLKQVYSDCHPEEVGKLDNCPFIWRDFRNLGYVTAYAEDWAEISTFNYNKRGFVDPPTDYYFKPYVEAAETLNITDEHAMPYCTGPETEGERILHLAKDFAVTFKEKPSFGIFWMNTFSHNDINFPSGMDEKVASFFRELKEKNVLRGSIVMVLSDHGIRFGKLRQSIQGWFEERLPLNFISIPSWFHNNFPEQYRAFISNTKKLTSTYDLYMTLQDVLKMSVPSYNVSSSSGCPQCKSIFSDISRERSCRAAGIPEAWCTCIGEFTTDDPRINDELNGRAVELALVEIRQFYEDEKNFSTVAKKIISSTVNRNRTRKSYLLLVFETDTGAIYQVLFRIRGDPVDIVRIVKIMRLW